MHYIRVQCVTGNRSVGGPDYAPPKDKFAFTDAHLLQASACTHRARVASLRDRK